jgi:hypothetical protein
LEGILHGKLAKERDSPSSHHENRQSDRAHVERDEENAEA